MNGFPPERAGRLLADFVAHLPMAAAAFDQQMRYLAHSPIWLAAHGAPSTLEVVGRSHYDVFPRIREEWRQVHQRCLLGATERRELDSFEREDGGLEYLRWTVTPWHLVDGTIGGILIYAENLSEQIATRRRLDEHESAIRDFFAESPVGLNLCRMDGRWLESNPAFLRIIGYSREEAEALTYWQLTPRKYDDDEARQLENLRSQRRYGPYEKEFIRKDGTLVPVRLNGFLIERGSETLIWSLIEDMTEQRALEGAIEEERLKAIQSSKLAVLGEMSAGLAHEINNPLSIIELYAGSLGEAIEANDEELITEALEGIRSAADRAAKIVYGLRKFSRNSRNEPPSDLSIASVVEDAKALCRPRIMASGVDVQVDVPSTTSVRGHPIELSQVLVNLLNNALDAARLSRGRWVRIRSEEGETFVTIMVEDSGGPLPQEVHDRIFRPFFTTKKVGEGTGLGLSISRSIVERHGGTLTVDREAPCTRFVVRLPRVISGARP